MSAFLAKAKCRVGTYASALTLLLVASISPILQAATPEQNPDNTAVNVRDSANKTLTPLDQSNTKSDTDIVARIRSTLTDEKSLSVNAKNVKVIVQDGVATLRGPVASSEEKQRVEMIAKNTAGVRQINSEIDIKH